MTPAHATSAHRRNMRYLLLIAGLGGLLYGIDVGIIAGALPYLEATSGLNANQLSVVVAAVLLGSVISTLFAGWLSDKLGRRPVMILSGVAFVVSVPMIALSHGYGALVLGRLLQGVSAGLVGVVVPLYLAECLDASNRGKGTGVFQWLLTLGIFAAALIAWIFSFRVEAIEQLQDAQRLFTFKNLAWRSIFWVSVIPGILFVIGSFFITESPRWLFRRGRKEEARKALMRTRPDEQADLELKEMAENAATDTSASRGQKFKESLLSRKYVIPFLLACVILACNQATGVNSIIGYNATILIQAGLSDNHAHLGYVLLTLVNFLMTWVGVELVDRKGRKFLLSLGSAGIVLSLVCVGLLFHRTEQQRVDCREALQAQVTQDQTLTLAFNQPQADALLEGSGEGGKALQGKPSTLVVIYSYGDFRAATKVVRSSDALASIQLTRASVVPSNPVVAFFSSPFASIEAAQAAPLKIENALITPVPSAGNGWLTAFCTFLFMAFFALGPGVCVWLALSELMPTRIRSNGMSIALLINQAVSTTIAAIFLPTVGKHGYGTMFFVFAGCSVLYFLVAAFLLPETKGKTLEEIESHFEGKNA